MESNFGSESRIEHRVVHRNFSSLGESSFESGESSFESRPNVESKIVHRDFGKRSSGAILKDIITAFENRVAPEYNNLEDIDKLIDKLVAEKIPNFQTQEGKEVLNSRQQKIEELKKLAEEIREQEKERKAIEEMRQENEMLDRIIASIRKQDNYGKRF